MGEFADDCIEQGFDMMCQGHDDDEGYVYGRTWWTPRYFQVPNVAKATDFEENVTLDYEPPRKA